MDIKLLIIGLFVQVLGIYGQGLQFDVFEGEITPHVSRWGYGDNMYGPSEWPNLFPIECARHYQSPIDIRTFETVYDPNLGRFQLSHDPRWPAYFELHNNGHAIQVNTIGKFYLNGGGLPFNYEIAQFHFHWGSDHEQGSEHTFNGRAFPMEMHIVAWNIDRYHSITEAAKHRDGLAVLGVLFEMSPYDNPELEPIVQSLSYVRDPDLNRSVILNPVDLQRFLPSNPEKYYRYKGSLTTPSCYESVMWSVFAKTRTISYRQLHYFQKLLTSSHALENSAYSYDMRVPLVDNFRHSQPLNGRTVFRSSPHIPSEPSFNIKTKYVYV